MKFTNINAEEFNKLQIILSFKTSASDGIEKFISTNNFQEQQFSKEEFRTIIIQLEFIIATYTNPYDKEIEKIILRFKRNWGKTYKESIYPIDTK